jgi:hypothetical protein
MYPVDLLKVRYSHISRDQVARLNTEVDTNANYQPLRRWPLHWLNQCGLYDIQNRGHPNVMEGCFERYCWCWWDRSLLQARRATG